MESYAREYPLLSLCGLNCGLCPRYHTNGVSKCPGCGGVATGVHEFVAHCGVNSCAKRHGGVEYCYLCEEYPCKKYYDSEKTKELAMVESNPKGRQVRKYFIECEKRLKAASKVISVKDAEKLRLQAKRVEIMERNARS